MTEVSAIGIQLRHHRKQRGMSQLDLATAANSTPRHISFIETGRSRPGRNVVLRIAGALSLTPRDINGLLVSAGLPDVYEEMPLDDEGMKPVKRIIEQMLKNHEPFPAWVIGPGVRFLGSNEAANRLFPGMVGMEPKNLIDLWCSPSVNTNEEERAHSVFQLLHGLRREVFHHPHPEIPQLIKQVESFARDLIEPADFTDSSVVGSTHTVGGKQVRTLTTVMRFDRAANVTMAEIRVELMFPADEESDRILRDMA